jgi:hypothetical protein
VCASPGMAKDHNSVDRMGMRREKLLADGEGRPEFNEWAAMDSIQRRPSSEDGREA